MHRMPDGMPQVRQKSHWFAANLNSVDGALLIMFVGLFIVVHAFQLHVVSHWGIERWHLLLAHPIDLLSVAMDSFRERALEGLAPDRARIAALLARSLMLVS